MSRPLSDASIVANGNGTTGRQRFGAAWRLAHRWKGRVLFALLDQGVYSLTNFLLTILYASWLPLDTFGRYVVVWTASLFVEAIQVSLIVDSLPAIVSRYGRRNQTRIDAAAFWVVIGYSAISSIFLALTALTISGWRPVYVSAFLALALVNPVQRLYLFVRRLCYIRDRQDLAAILAVIYGAVSIAGALVLLATGAISLTAIILLWGLGAFAAVIAAIISGVGQPRALNLASVAWLAIELWRSGRWLSGAAIASWVNNWAIFPLIAATTGAGTAGIVRALQNLLTPAVQFNAALHLAILPRVADKVADVGDHYAAWFARRGTIIFTAIAATYCAIILAAAHLILPVLYRKPEIVAAANLLWPLALAVVLDALRQASTMSLLAKRSTRIVFTARWAALVVFAGASLLFTAFIGYPGILWATAAASLTGAVILLGTALSENWESR